MEEEQRQTMERLGKYVPFLQDMVEQLRDPSKNKERQLHKIELLLNMVTDQKKKYKLETLNKCEQVIKNLYQKVNHRTLEEEVLTPASPSPPRDPIPSTSKPVVIPTEKVSKLQERPRIDVYSSAVVSSDRLPVLKPIPDISKPPISLEDLKSLQEEVGKEEVSSNDPSFINKTVDLESINTTVRNKTIFTKKNLKRGDERGDNGRQTEGRDRYWEERKYKRDDYEKRRDYKERKDYKHRYSRERDDNRYRDRSWERKKDSEVINLSSPEKPEIDCKSESSISSIESEMKISESAVQPNRLAFKYNPKPRKASIEADESKVKEEEAQRKSRPPTPFKNRHQEDEDRGKRYEGMFFPDDSIGQIYNQPQSYYPRPRHYFNQYARGGYYPMRTLERPRLSYQPETHFRPYGSDCYGYEERRTPRTYREHKEMKEKEKKEELERRDPRLRKDPRLERMDLGSRCLPSSTAVSKEKIETQTETLNVTETPKETETKPEEPKPEPEKKEKEEEKKVSSDQNVLAQFFSHLMNSQDKKEKKGALLSLISTFSDSFSQAELEKITKIMKARDSSDEEEEDKKKDEEKAKKTRKPKAKRSELDKLHDDIQGMFIRDGVLTANGKRMCRYLKGESTVSPSRSDPEEVKKKRITRSRKEEEINLMDVSVVLQKIPDISTEGIRRSLRSSTKAAEEEKNKKNVEEEREASEEEEEENVTVFEPKKRLKRKRSKWSSGIIEKKKKRKISESKEVPPPPPPSPPQDLDKSFIEPDKNYFIPPNEKSNCKLCDFSSQSLAFHYKKEHPQSEVLSSRLPPKQALEAIEDSIKNLESYEKLSPPKAKELLRYECRFCGVKSKSKTMFFYDHISTHTGEFRHICGHCDYFCSSNKTLRNHYNNSHPGCEISKSLPILPGILFGYICSDCNYTQLNKNAIEDHIKIYHLGDSTKIYKINISSCTDDFVPKKVKPKEKKAEEVIIERPNKREAKLRATAKLKEQCAEIEKEEERVEEKKEKEKAKPVEMNVFTCGDICEDIDTIEKERMEKMEEINRIVTRSSSLNFVDKLSSILQEKELHIKSEEPVEEEQSFVEEELKKKPSLEALDPVEKLKGVEVNEKSNKLITGMIQKLRKTLQQEVKVEVKEDRVEEPPSLCVLTDSELTNGAIEVLNCGYLKIYKKDGVLRFMCCVYPCAFISDDRECFRKHCSSQHQQFDVEDKKTKCIACDGLIVPSGEATILEQLFEHALEAHKVVLEGSALKVRKLCGDKLSVKQEDVKEEKEDNPFSFTITDVVSLAEEVPPLTPLQPLAQSSSPGQKLLMFRELPLCEQEKLIPKKSQQALKVFMDNLNDLYKCPLYSCPYTSNSNEDFAEHLKTHPIDVTLLVPCVYCDFKTAIKDVAMHINIRHAHCKMACKYCLYRGFVPEYVKAHQEDRHPNAKFVYRTLKIKTNPKNSSPDCNVKIKNICRPYRCYDGCGQFLYRNEFELHMMVDHGSEEFVVCMFSECGEQVQPGAMLEHWEKVHGVKKFQCANCWVSCDTKEEAIRHYAKDHASFRFSVYLRETSFVGEQFLYVTPLAFTYMQNITSLDLKSPPQTTPPIPNGIKVVSLKTYPPKSKPKSSSIAANLFGDCASTEIIVEPSLSFVQAEGVRELVPRPEAEEPEMDRCLSSEDENEKTKSKALKSGLTGFKLYRCAFCQSSFEDMNSFKVHTKQSQNCRNNQGTKPFKCVHCGKSSKTIYRFMEHISFHGPARISCSLCVEKFATQFQTRLHMKNKHNIVSISFVPVQANKSNLEEDLFIARPKQAQALQPIKQENAEVVVEKSSYMPEELNDLPMKAIFLSCIKCAKCGYSTKVKTNLVRHFHFHLSQIDVPDAAPVNPVPCLEKNEKMFDKMTNLAYNSLSSKMGKKVEKVEENFPEFVSSSSRFVCCAQECNYLCLEESNLRHHLMALHDEESNFTCPHCKKDLGNSDVDALMKHLKLHGLSLYKCGYCGFVHNLKHKIEKHLSDCHKNSEVRIVTLRNLEFEPKGGDVEPPVNTVKKPWRCCMCKYKCASKEEIEAHASIKHNIDCQYKCTLCNYKSNSEDTFGGHFKEQHEGFEIDLIYVYRKLEEDSMGKSFDTTPLWQRDRPRVRHIRGILFDEIVPAKSPKKKLEAKIVEVKKASNLDLAIETVASGVPEEFFKSINKKIEEAEVNEEVFEVSDEKLKEKFGEFCGPVNKSFQCPKCKNFKGRSVEEFIIHVLSEFEVTRFKCLECQLRTVTFQQMCGHWAEKHPGVVKVAELEKNEELVEHIVWMQRLIRYQSLVMLNCGVSASTGTKLICNVGCDFCDLKFRNINEQLDHEILHWSRKPFRCSKCEFGGDLEETVRDHIRDKHENLGLMVREALVEDVITKEPKKEVMKRKQDIQSEQKTKAIKVDETEIKSDDTFGCKYCPKMFSNVANTETHLKRYHKKPMIEFVTYYRITDQRDKKCGNCEFEGNEFEVRQHSAEQHPLTRFRINNGNVEEKEKEKEKEKEVRKVKNMAKEFCCTICDYKSVSNKTNNIRAHLRSHKKYFTCMLCSRCFKMRCDAQDHHVRLHPGQMENIVEDKALLKEYNELCRQVVDSAKRVENRTARKSTGKLCKPIEEYSFYGGKRDRVDFKKIVTSVEVNKVLMTMSADKLGSIFNLFPVVEVEKLADN